MKTPGVTSEKGVDERVRKARAIKAVEGLN